MPRARGPVSRAAGTNRFDGHAHPDAAAAGDRPGIFGPDAARRALLHLARLRRLERRSGALAARAGHADYEHILVRGERHPVILAAGEPARGRGPARAAATLSRGAAL